MFKIGEYINYGHCGICKIEDITHLNIAGADKKRLYYVLNPINIKGNRIYFPVDKENVSARRLISKQEACQFLDEIPSIGEIWVENEKQREEKYKEALNSGECRQWVSIIKTLYQRKQVRLSQGKKMPAVDEKYMKLAEDALYNELAFVLGKAKEEMVPLLKEHIEKLELK